MNLCLHHNCVAYFDFIAAVGSNRYEPRHSLLEINQSYKINQKNSPLLYLYFNFYDVFYVFRTRGFIFRKTIVRTDVVKFVYTLEHKQTVHT